MREDPVGGGVSDGHDLDRRALVERDGGEEVVPIDGKTVGTVETSGLLPRRVTCSIGPDAQYAGRLVFSRDVEIARVLEGIAVDAGEARHEELGDGIDLGGIE